MFTYSSKFKNEVSAYLPHSVFMLSIRIYQQENIFLRPWKFSSDVILLPVFSSSEVHSALDRTSAPRNCLGGKEQPTREPDNCAVLVMP